MGSVGRTGAKVYFRPSFTTMSYSAFVTGWTDSRLPFWVTTMCSSSFVPFKTSSGTVA